MKPLQKRREKSSMASTCKLVVGAWDQRAGVPWIEDKVWRAGRINEVLELLDRICSRPSAIGRFDGVYRN